MATRTRGSVRELVHQIDQTPPISERRSSRMSTAESLTESLSVGRKPKKMVYPLMVAIDFGTTYSGYAFLVTHRPERVYMNKNWGEDVGFLSYKTATSVLVGPEGQFDSFGFQAENKYNEMSIDEDDCKRYCLFRHFKMLLYNEKNITRETMITATNGMKMPALDIFAMALRYLKEHLLHELKKQLAKTPRADHISWVLTVPAIWADHAKQFMREAAVKAELIKDRFSRQLLIALEPEAASLFCRHEDTDFVEGTGAVTQFKTGTKYLVIDAGGGTIDITAHEVLEQGNVRELVIANGGSWGGTSVDRNFIKLLIRHRRDKRIVEDGVAYCNDVFDRFVKKGDPIAREAVITKVYFPRYHNQPYMTFDIFYTDEEELAEVEYVDSDKFRRAGYLMVDMPKEEGNKYRKVEVEFQFGGTEIEVSGKDLTSGAATKTTIDLLLGQDNLLYCYQWV